MGRYKLAKKRFDDRSAFELASALARGDCETVHLITSTGGSAENRKARCNQIADQTIRRLGGLPLPNLEPIYITYTGEQ